MNDGPAPGWYPAPGEHNTQRYWDGQAWTDQRAPLAGGTQAPGPPGTGLVVAGWICAFLFPIAGFVIGTLLLDRPGTGKLEGRLIIFVSLLVMAIAIFAFALLVEYPIAYAIAFRAL